MNIEYFRESLESLLCISQKLTPEQKLLIENSLIALQTENQFPGVYFWGRINGITKDYYIAFGFTRDCLKDRKYFYSTDGFQWQMLPFVQNPKTFQATMLCPHPFSGDPSKSLTVKLDPTFQLNAKNVMTIVGVPQEIVLKEVDRLAAIVFIITEECAVCPRGALYKMMDGCVIPNPMFHGLEELQVEQLAYYQIYRLPRNNLINNLTTRSDYNYTIDFLDLVEDVLPKRRAFTLTAIRNKRMIIIKSCLWVGMTFFHKFNSRKHGFVYFGDGKKNYDMLFMYEQDM